MRNRPRRWLSLGLSLVCLFSSVLAVRGDESFSDWETRQFKETLQEDFMSLHFSVKDPSKFGISVNKVTMGDRPSRQTYEKGMEKNKKALQELTQFDVNSLSENEKIDYEILKDYLEASSKDGFYDFDFHFLPQTGLISNLVTNFSEFKISNLEEAKQYLELVKSVPEFIDGALEVTKDQASRGFFMTDKAVEKTVSQIDKFVEKTEDNSLILSFQDRLKKANLESSDLIQKNKDVILNQFIPSYLKVKETLVNLKGSRKGESLYQMEGGLAYYQSLLASQTSTKGLPKEVFDLADHILDKELKALVSVATRHKESELSETMEEKKPEEILEQHRLNLENFLPSPAKVSYEVDYLDSSVANDGVVAYYLNPPIDDLENNVIRINQDAVSDTNEMYSTLAHEGYPGHLYQMTWFLNTNPHPVRSILGHLGYTEGWAMYVEDAMWKYSSLNEAAKEYNRSLTNINYILSALVDIGVNGMGWSLADIKTYVNNKGLDGEVAKSLYEVVTQDPGAYLPYGIGLAQFLRMKDEALSKNPSMDLKDLNKMFLNHGDRPFWMVQRDLDQILSSDKKEVFSMQKVVEDILHFLSSWLKA